MASTMPFPAFAPSSRSTMRMAISVTSTPKMSATTRRAAAIGLLLTYAVPSLSTLTWLPTGSRTVIGRASLKMRSYDRGKQEACQRAFPLLVEAVLTDQRHEHDRLPLPAHRVLPVPLHQRQPLVHPRADRHDELASVRVQLSKQRLRDRWTGRRHQDHVVRRPVGIPPRPVADHQLDVLVAGLAASVMAATT